MEQIKITTLIENTTSSVFATSEWGLSLLIQTPKQSILFDTGSGHNMITRNADVLNIDVEHINTIILSHGHKDHTGGLKDVLERINQKNNGRKTKIICHPESLAPKYVKVPDTEKIFFYGFPFVAEEIEDLGGMFNFSKKPVWVEENVVVSGEIPMVNDYETVGNNFLVKKNNDLNADPDMIDDQALYIKSSKGLIVVMGCAHRGMINTIYHAQEVTNTEKVYMVIGGTHLENASEKRMKHTIEELKKLEVEKIGVSHCTGLKESAILLQEFGREKFFFNNVGTITNI